MPRLNLHHPRMVNIREHPELGKLRDLPAMLGQSIRLRNPARRIAYELYPDGSVTIILMSAIPGLRILWDKISMTKEAWWALVAVSSSVQSEAERRRQQHELISS